MISITGQQGDQEPLELLTAGEYRRDGDAVTLEYEESELSGMQGCHTSVSFEGPQVVLRRRGRAQSCMVFAKRQTSHSLYRVDELELDVSVFPTVLEYELSDEEGWLELVYEIDLGGHRAVNKLSLEYRPREGGHAL